MASIREIAREAGVSPATVSRAINNNPAVTPAMRSKILSVVNRSRYMPTVSRRETTNIAFAYTGEPSLGSPYDAALMLGMSDRMEQCGFDLMVIDLQRALMPHESYSQLFMRKGIRGCVLRTTTRTRHVCEQIAAEGFASIVLADRFDDAPVSYIYADSKNASRDAVEHLLGLGHRRIAIARNLVDDADHADRFAGYREALAAHNIEYDERLDFRLPASRDGGTQLIRRIAAMPQAPTAAYITDPESAAAAMVEAHRMGWQIPRDLSIVGFDDGELRYLTYPHMTAVCQDAREIGREAFECLQQLIGATNRHASIQRSLPTVLAVHGSTAAPRGGPK